MYNEWMLSWMVLIRMLDITDTWMMKHDASCCTKSVLYLRDQLNGRSIELFDNNLLKMKMLVFFTTQSISSRKISSSSILDANSILANVF